MIKKIIDNNIRIVQPNTVLVYKENDKYTIYYKDVFVIYSLCKFKFYRIGNIFEMYIEKKYLNYILKQLTDNNISYLIIDKKNQYHIVKRKIYKIDNNNYIKFYSKGRMLYKRRKQINKIIFSLKKKYIIESKLEEIYYMLEGECHELTKYL